MLRVWLLGQFQVQVEGKRAVISTRAAQSLLAFLILTAGTFYRREKLAGMLWPDMSDESARRNLRHELWRLRKALGANLTVPVEYILSEELAIQFNPHADYWLDVAQLERAPAPDDSVGDLIGRVALYRGELLPGFYDDWVAPERDRVQAVYETRMRELLERLIAGQQWQTVVSWSEKWIALGQTPEAAYRALMLAYAMLGDRAQCAATYERCAKVLSQELDVEPSDETHALYENLMRGASIARVNLNAPRILIGVKPALYNELPAPGEPPFKGLEFFDEQDANLFFGREELIKKLANEIRTQRFLAVVVGASGSGKSSVVRAGLIPTLRGTGDRGQGTDENWRVFVMTPTAHPLEALATVLTRDESLTVTAQLMDDLAREPRSLHLYFRRRTIDEGRRTDQDPRPSSSVVRRLLLVVDQFEELFTLCHDDLEREQFIDNLVNALNQSSVNSQQSTVSNLQSPISVPHSSALTLVLTIRADFYAHLAHYPELRDLVAKQQEFIGPMNAEELRRAIEEPAKQGAADGAAWEFEPGLVDLILRDVGSEPGALPLLSHALLETWKRRSGHWMTLKGYHDAGGVRGAIANTAETTYQQLSPGQQTIARNIFLRLTELGEGTEDTRRRAEFGELEIYTEPGHATADWERVQVRQVLTLLADARLITTHKNTAEVAHEALIREWPRLREWLNQDREGLKLHRHLTEAAHEWELMERDASVLYRGARLAQAREWSEQNPYALNVQERAFLDASEEQEKLEAREREKQQQRELAQAQKLAEEQERRADVETKRAEEQTRANKRLRQRALFLAGVMVLALVLAGIALFLGDSANRNAASAEQNAAQAETNANAAEAARLNAEKEKRAATARELAAASVINLEVDPERSILLALQAVDATRRTEDVVLQEAEEALHRALQTSRISRTIQTGRHQSENVVLSPDGTRLAASDAEGNIHLLDTATGGELLRLNARSRSSDHLYFNADGTQLAFVDGSDDETKVTAKIFDSHSGQMVNQIKFPINQSDWTISAFAPDWKHLATGEMDGTTRIWNLESGRAEQTLAAASAVQDVAFSPDGKQIATAYEDGTAKLWDATTGAELKALHGHREGILRIHYNADGTRIGAASRDGTAKVWDAATGELLLDLTGQGDWVSDIHFSRDDKRILTVSFSRGGIVWDAQTGERLMTLAGHYGFTKFGALNPDGSLAVTSGNDGTIRIWDLAESHEFLSVPTTAALSTQTLLAGNVAYSPDGASFAVGLRDGRVKIWDAVTGREIVTLYGHAGPVHRIAFSPNGTRLVSAGNDQTARIWDAATGKELFVFREHTRPVVSVAFSPDGKRAASGGFDNTLRVWDVQTGKVYAEIDTAPFTTNDAEVLYWLVFSPDGKQLAASFGDGTLVNLELDTGKPLFAFNRGPEGIFDAVFSPDGSRLAIASPRVGAQVLNATTGIEIFSLGDTITTADHIAYSRDGARLATAHVGEAAAKVWDAATGKQLLTLHGAPSGVISVEFSPDGTQLALASNNDIRVYLLRVEDLIALAKTRVTRSLTQEECQKYLHVEKCPQ